MAITARRFPRPDAAASSLVAHETQGAASLPYVVEALPENARGARSSPGLWLTLALLALSACIYAIYFFHLRADFPNRSPLSDWAKFTDEGWYANAAVRRHLWGHWFLPGDFNPAVAVPLWPLLAAGLFHFTGVSIAAARALTVAIFGGTLMLLYLLVRRSQPRTVALAAVALTVSSPFLYSFERLAILEPLLLFLMVASMLVARAAARGALRGSRRGLPLAHSHALLLGLLLLALTLTKTTAVSLFPAIFYLLWWPLRSRMRRFLAVAATAVGCYAALGAAYYFALVRPRYRLDFWYLFQANRWGHPKNWRLWVESVEKLFRAMLWPDRVFAFLALAAVALSLFRPFRRLWREPLFPASVLVVAGTVLFVFWHNNQQPRYFLVTAIPYYLLALYALSALLRRSHRAGLAACAVVAGAGCWNLGQTLEYARHPDYTWWTAARGLTAYIDSHPSGNRLLLSISGDDISLMTGLPAICDDFGTDDLPQRIERYQPGWYAAWDDVDPGTLEDIHVRDRLVKVASFPAMNDPDRAVLVLYRMLPQPGPDEGVIVEQ